MPAKQKKKRNIELPFLALGGRTSDIVVRVEDGVNGDGERFKMRDDVCWL